MRFGIVKSIFKCLGVTGYCFAELGFRLQCSNWIRFVLDLSLVEKKIQVFVKKQTQTSET
jgi:hypothetical protein